MIKDISRDEVKQLVAAGAQLIEVLPPEDFASEHLPGATNLHLSKLTAETAAAYDKSRPVITYCFDLQ